MIDLQPFCSTDPERPYLGRHFSVGDWTYATNGHIMVRVPRRDDAPETPGSPNVQRVVDEAGPLPALRALGRIKFPRAKTEECIRCDGRGTDHDCPDCKCQCRRCGGAGTIPERTTVSLGGVPFDAKYIRLVIALPNVRFAERPSQAGPAWFVFDGGEGFLMPMRTRADHHVEAWPAEAAEGEQ